MFRKKPSTIWSIPESEADCAFDVDDEAFGEQNPEPMEEDHNEQEEEEEEEEEGEETGEEEWHNEVAETELQGFVKFVKLQIQNFQDQFNQQNTYNNAIQQNMETVSQEYERLREELSALSRAKSGTTGQRKVGRPRREAQ
ncbi:hypothetical protein N7523_010218 [Penicillium sp. IBT 18751x]|nr:hypothetical protein N7523_010218 [Penicillium sp. IBT 18751x]